MRLFGGKKKDPLAGPEAPPALQKVNEAISILTKKEAYEDKIINDLTAKAKAELQKNRKPEALRLLKTKKLHENQRDNIRQQLDNLGVVKFRLEQSSHNPVMVDAMKAAKVEMDRQKKLINEDTVSKLMDGLNDTMEDANRVNEELARPLGGQVFDEDELLEQFEQEQMDAGLAELEEEPELGAPSAPTHIPESPVPKAAAGRAKTAVSDEESELAQLKASMMMM